MKNHIVMVMWQMPECYNLVGYVLWFTGYPANLFYSLSGFLNLSSRKQINAAFSISFAVSRTS